MQFIIFCMARLCNRVFSLLWDECIIKKEIFRKNYEGGNRMDIQSLKQLETTLWDTADNLRANSKLTSQQYCMPVLGLIFLR